MYKLTKVREAKALSILKEAYQSLRVRGCFDVYAFERELRGLWNIGYHELYDVMEDAFRDQRWRYVAVYYMERISGPCLTCELRHALTKAYGVEKWNDKTAWADARARFWDGFEAV